MPGTAEIVLRLREQSLHDRETGVAGRERAARLREAASGVREESQRATAFAHAEIETRNGELRLANENLVFATLAAEEVNEAAEQARRRQDEFLAMLAHELRNPLAPIRGAVALLQRLETNEPALTAIREVIGRQVEHMARLLDDLLDASRVTSGKVTLKRRPMAVAEFVVQAVELCRDLIDARRQRLTLDLPVAPVYVDGDPVRLTQIVGNLLHNAAKYTPEGGAISVRVRALGQTVEIRVADNGSGISAAALPHIYDLFTQEERALSRSQGGLGIGLTVVRSMAELHGGTVDAHSAGLGQGSEFTVHLPRVEQGAGTDATVAAAPGASAALAVRVLLIDDNVDANSVLAQLLQVCGHEVTSALDGPSALALFDVARPQIVLCDIGLPGMNGYEVVAHLLERCTGAPPVMVALTGYGGDDDRARALAAGFDHHLVKPVDPEALLRLVESTASTAPDIEAGTRTATR